MLLSILIPTYNRAEFLLKNLECLKFFIRNSSKGDDIEIIVSNNCSSDTTDAQVRSFVQVNPDINFSYYYQQENIGLEKNALFVLGKALGEYVMYLGDDDFLDNRFFNEVVKHITQNIDTSVIIPNYIPVSINGDFISKPRDSNYSRIYEKGYKSCLINAWRGHQMSGLVLKRDGLFEQYIKNDVNSIYLFIYFTAYSCLRGDIFHLAEFPVKVTQPGQLKKDWGYGDDGLLNEVFKNYDKLALNILQKTLLQLKHFIKQPWRLVMYRQHGIPRYFSAFKSIWFSQSSSRVFTILFPITVIYVESVRALRRIKKKLIK